MEKNLGHATAYGYAKSKGYSGTEEEFAELMADYASVGQSAAQSAEQAAASATSASGSATTASQAAQTATSKASEAVTAADTATTKASEASQSASTASTAATSASTSAQTATTAASTATTKASEAAASEAAALSAKTDAESARDAAAQSASDAAASAESIDPDEFNRKIYAAFATDTATGAIASFADGADSIPMKDVLVHIEPMQEGSGDPSPDNVRPISGWTAAKVTRAGKNLIDDSIRTMSGQEITIGSMSSRGECAFLKPGTYTISAYFNKAIQRNLYLRDLDEGTIVSGFPAYINSDVNPAVKTFTLTKATRVAFWLYNAELESVDDIAWVQLELGSTATAYEPYNGSTYSITFPTEAGTVYGGTLDVTKGELVVDVAMVDLGTLSWTYYHSGDASGFYANVPNKVNNTDVLCDKRKFAGNFASAYTAITGMSDKQIAGFSNTTSADRWVYARDDSYTSASDFKSAITGTSIVYKLATPITYQLTPQETQEITSLFGTNSLWADTGDSDVEYRADTKLYIARQIADAVSALS